MGATHAYNFLPSSRPVPLDLFVKSYDHNDESVRFSQMMKPTYNIIKKHSEQKPTITFVRERKQVRELALELISSAENDEEVGTFLIKESDSLDKYVERVKEETLKHSLRHGIGYLHEGLEDEE